MIFFVSFLVCVFFSFFEGTIIQMLIFDISLASSSYHKLSVTLILFSCSVLPSLHEDLETKCELEFFATVVNGLHLRAVVVKDCFLGCGSADGFANGVVTLF